MTASERNRVESAARAAILKMTELRERAETAERERDEARYHYELAASQRDAARDALRRIVESPFVNKGLDVIEQGRRALENSGGEGES